jgi:uncharacterized membrane protein YbhN (UPF0104 family)
MTDTRRARAVALLIVKVLVTGTLIAWVLSRIQVRELAGNLRASLGGCLLAAVIVGAFNITLTAVRWRFMLVALGASLPLGKAIRLLWAGLFFNAFLPSGMVGDALRGAWAARSLDGARAYWSVLLDRVAAMVALTAICAIGLALPDGRALPAAPTLMVACAVLGLPALATLAAPEQIARLAARVGGARVRRALEGRITDPPAGGPRLKALLLAGVVHLTIVLDVVLIARAARLQLPWTLLLVVVPAMLVASYVPVSISGIGVRDVALVELLGQAGVPAASALTVSFLILGISLLLSLAGGVVYLYERARHTPEPPPLTITRRRAPRRSHPTRPGGSRPCRRAGARPPRCPRRPPPPRGLHPPARPGRGGAGRPAPAR